MTAHVTTVAFQGVRAVEVDVQVQVGPGMVSYTIVGLADKAVNEAKERVRAALSAIGLSLPAKRITINLAPADLPKEGSHYDLPIALGLLAAMGVVPGDALAGYTVMGELSLDGAIARVDGVLPAAITANGEGRGIVCPKACGAEAAWAGDMDIVAAADLLSLINHFKGTQVLVPPPPPAIENDAGDLPDLRDIKGQESAKRALEVAASGGHNLLMVGPPGAGKSMLAARLPGILPALTPTEALESWMIASLAGALDGEHLSKRRPYRAPHHSASMPALVGGGRRPKPGEVSLAHLGVLFLDELAEFPRQVLDSLRQPIETGETVVSRAEAHVTFPARFQLVAAMNPCKCGYLGDASQACSRAPKCALDYQARISGPLLDRFDIQIEVPPVAALDLSLPPPTEGSVDVIERVNRARGIQNRRYAETAVRTNAEADGELLDTVAKPQGDAMVLLQDAAGKLKLTARGFHRVLRVARTLADLDPAHDPADPPGRLHIAEALSYRSLRRAM